MKRAVVPVLLGILVFGTAVLLRHGPTEQSAMDTAQPDGAAQRIVSLSPSVTETLFALGLGPRVVGVTRFCAYPPEAKALPRVGGFVDPDYEALVSLSPDLAILRADNTEGLSRLAQLGIPCIAVSHTTLEGILTSIRDIGRRAGMEERATGIIADFRARMDAASKRNRFDKPPRVLISVGRFMGSGSVKDVYAAGKDELYDEALRIAGAVNACGELGRKYPQLDAESILRLDPDLIIDLAADRHNPEDHAAIIRDWQGVPGLRAAAEGRIRILTGDYVTVPGPRFIRLIEDVTAIVGEMAK